MKCPCCKNELTMFTDHVVPSSEGIEARHYKVLMCKLGGQYCNGLVIKHDVYENKKTFITPCHTTTTLHSSYIQAIHEDDLLRSIFTVFEWEAYLNERNQRSAS